MVSHLPVELTPVIQGWSMAPRTTLVLIKEHGTVLNLLKVWLLKNNQLIMDPLSGYCEQKVQALTLGEVEVESALYHLVKIQNVSDCRNVM